jgi:transcriptional regulator with XRE-family HTH domain
MPELDLTNMPERTPEAVRQRHGNRLRRGREELGLTQREVAERLETSHTTIGKSEQGIGSEELFDSLWRLYGLVDAMPGAPKDPIRRREYVDHRSAVLAKGIKSPASGTFGKAR